MTDDENTKKRLGEFEIIRELGRGGMGVVYEARQVSLNRKRSLCEAHFMIAMTLLSDGDREGATDHFGKSVATHVRFPEADMSRAFLARLERDRSWPPWIPVKEGARAT